MIRLRHKTGIGWKTLELRADDRPGVRVEVTCWEDSLVQVEYFEEVTSTFGFCRAFVMPYTKALPAALRALRVGEQALEAR
jgi:hypothetical protein